MSGPRPLRLALSPSPILAALIVGLHGAAAAAAAAVMPGTAGLALAAALGALGLAAAWSRALLGSRASVRALELSPAGLTVELAGGARIALATPARRYVSRFAVALPLARPLGRTLLVSADMLDAEGFRRLRLWALWAKPPAVAGEQLPA